MFFQEKFKKVALETCVEPTTQEAFWLLSEHEPNLLEISCMLPKRNITLVGTSIFSSIKISLDLTLLTKHQSSLIIVDNSIHVINAWNVLKKFCKDPAWHKIDNYQLAIRFINFILDKRCHETAIDIISKEEQYKLFTLFFNILNKYGQALVNQTITSAVICLESWCNSRFFMKLSHACKNTIMLAYPSNIISCQDNARKTFSVAQSVIALSPIFSIHKDLQDGEPKNCYILAGTNDPKKIIQKVGFGPFIDTSKLLLNLRELKIVFKLQRAFNDALASGYHNPLCLCFVKPVKQANLKKRLMPK